MSGVHDDSGLSSEGFEAWNRFEDAWANDQRPRIEDYLVAMDEVQQRPLFSNLLGTDLERRMDRGEEPRFDEYRKRFPNYADLIEAAFREVPALADPSDGNRSAPVTGDTVRYFGDYEVFETLGFGGMGVVFRARQVRLDRFVALKVLTDRMFASPAARRRFQMEAEAVAQLDHSGIVPIYEVGEHGGKPYFSMKLVEGGSLDKRLDHYSDKPEAAARLVAEAAEAVQHAHIRGILHRDLKPANILMGEQDHPLVTDFGLAKRTATVSGITLSNEVLGTPSYMAPEQTTGRRGAATTSADVYGLGAVFYALLTGRAPFDGEDPMEIMQEVREKAPKPPRRLNPRVPRDLEVICLKCLEKEPKRRYASAGGLADDLDHWLHGEPITARSTSSWERLWKWARRNPAIAAVILVSVLGISGIVWQWRKARAYANEVSITNVALGTAIRTTRNLAEEATKARDDAEHEREKVSKTNDALKDALLRAKQNAYAAHIKLAQNEWDGNNLEHARELLDNAEEVELRGFEWYYLHRRYNPNELSWKGPSGRITRIAISPDSKRIASAGGTVRVWDATNGRELHTLKGHSHNVNDVAFSPDGKRIASASADDTIKVWDAANGKELHTLKGHSHMVESVAFSPDGKRIASASYDQTVKIWDSTNGRELHTLKGHSHVVNDVAFSPDGKRIASASHDQTVKVWDATNGQELRTLRGHTHWVKRVAFSPDGERIASGGFDLTVRVWDAAGELRHTLRHPGDVTGVSYSPDGKYLASAGSKTIKVWEALNGGEMFVLKGYTLVAEDVVFSTDGTYLASAGDNETIKVWDAVTFQEAISLERLAQNFSGFAFSPDRKRLAWASSRQKVSIRDAATGRLVCNLQHKGVDDLTFSFDGSRLATGGFDKTVKVWDLANGQELLTLDGHAVAVYSVAFDPKGERLAAGSFGPVKVWGVATGRELLTLKGHKGAVYGVAFDPDGQRIASASTDGTVKVWDAANGQELLTLKGDLGNICGVAFSPDGARIASASKDRTVKVWDAANGQELLTLKGHTGSVYSVAFSPDGQRIVSASGDDTVKIWDATAGHELLTLNGHNSGVFRVAFDPNGKRLISASGDGTLAIWNPVSKH